MQKSEDKNIYIYSPLIRVFSLYHGRSSKDIFPILDIAEFKCVNLYKAAGCGPQRLERIINLNNGQSERRHSLTLHKLHKMFPRELKKNDWHCLVFIRADLWGKNIKFKRSVCQKRLVDFDLNSPTTNCKNELHPRSSLFVPWQSKNTHISGK